MIAASSEVKRGIFRSKRVMGLLTRYKPPPVAPLQLYDSTSDTSPPKYSPPSQLKTMEPLSENQRQYYQTQHDIVTLGFQATGSDPNTASWRSLGTRLEQALSDPALPGHHRVSYHLISAWCVPDPLLQIERTREAIRDIGRDLRAAGRAEWEVNGFLERAWGVVAVVEGAFKERIGEKKACEEKYAALFLCAQVKAYTIANGIEGKLRL